MNILLVILTLGILTIVTITLVNVIEVTPTLGTQIKLSLAHLVVTLTLTQLILT